MYKTIFFVKIKVYSGWGNVFIICSVDIFAFRDSHFTAIPGTQKSLKRICALGVTWSMSGPLPALPMSPDTDRTVGPAQIQNRGYTSPGRAPGSRPSCCAFRFSPDTLFFPGNKTPNCPAEGVSSLLLASRPGFCRVLTIPRVCWLFPWEPELPENTCWLKWMPPEDPLWFPSKFITCVTLPPQPIFSQSLCY